MSFEIVCERCSDHNFFNLDSLMTPQDILKTRIKKYANDNFSNNKRTFILSKCAKGAPFSQE